MVERGTAKVGRFVVVEGIDGCGSTTQAKRLVEALRGVGHDARATFEPSDGPVGQLLRSVLEGRLRSADGQSPRRLDWAALGLLFAADRLDHLASFVRPALAEGAIVVSDRYTLSSIVYQSVTAPAVPDAVSWIASLNRAAQIPDLTIVLDVPVAVAARRRHARGGPEELFDALSTQARLADAYARAVELAPEQHIRHVSGEGDAGDVTRRLLQVLSDAFPEISVTPERS